MTFRVAGVRAHGAAVQPMHRVAVRRAVIASVLLLCLLTWRAGSAHAQTTCTSSWTGTAGDLVWGTASNWSTGAVPTATDVACIGAGKVVYVLSSASAASVQASGASLTIQGTLALSSTATPSALGTLRVEGNGNLTGAAEVNVMQALVWTGGTMSGSGSTIVDAGATASISPSSSSGWVVLNARTLSNKGTLGFTTGTIFGYNAATIRNSGTFNANSQGGSTYGPFTHQGGTIPQLINTSTGTIQKTVGTGSTSIGFTVDNQGLLDAQTGKFAFGGAAVTLGAASHLAGTILITGAAVTADTIAGTTATVQLAAGSLLIGSGTSTIGTLVMTGGTLWGPGDLVVTQSLSWTGGAMTGTGAATIVDSFAVGSISPTGASGGVTLDGRTLTNRGTLTLSSGTIFGYNAAAIRNSGTFNANSEGGPVYGPFTAQGGATPQLINTSTGTFQKTVGTGSTSIGFTLDNQGMLDGHTGSFALGSSAVTLGSASRLAGTILISGSAVTAGSVLGDTATVQLDAGSLLMATGATSTIGSLVMSGGTLWGPGELDVMQSLTWTGGTMSGTGGATVVDAAASGSISPPNLTGGVTLDGRTLSNRGSLTFSSGGLFGYNGATIRNSGTLNADSDAGTSGALVAKTGAIAQLINTDMGTVRKTAGTGVTSISFAVDNHGLIDGQSGRIAFVNAAVNLATGSRLAGTVLISTGAAVTAGTIHGEPGTVELETGGSLLMASGSMGTIGTLTMIGGTVWGPGELDITHLLTWTGGTMSGSGASTVIESTALATIGGGVLLDGRTLSNRGTITQGGTSTLWGRNGAIIDNRGVYTLNTEPCAGCSTDPGLTVMSGGAAPLFANRGILQKTQGAGVSHVFWSHGNVGIIKQQSGTLSLDGAEVVLDPDSGESRGGGNGAIPSITPCKQADPVDCATGDFFEDLVDLAIPGRGRPPQRSEATAPRQRRRRAGSPA